MPRNVSLFLAASLLLITFQPDAALSHRPPPEAREGVRRHERAVPGSYIVVLKDEVAGGHVPALAAQLTLAQGGQLAATYRHALKGFAARLSARSAEALARHPLVAYVEEDGVVELAATQTNAPWGLDRTDQRDLPLSTTYTYGNTGAGVNAYVIDTGIRTTHEEFEGRASVAFDNVNDGQNGEDCHGHGTHVASLVGGKTYGVAKGVQLWSVRVFNCSNASTVAKVVGGIDFVTSSHQSPAVAVLSVSSGGSTSLDTAVSNSIAAGVTYAVAAGNSNTDAGTRSPARVAEAVTVGATDQNDARASFSNFGSVLDLFAPGVDIPGANWFDDTSTSLRSGTSMAAAHVAGVAARYLSANPSEPPDAVGEAIVSAATRDKVGGEGTGSPDRLLYGGMNGKIAFSRYVSPAQEDIYVMNSDGSNQVRLTDDPAEDSAPAWSPDGSKIAFMSYRDGNSEIYVMDADGANQTRITNNDTDDYDPKWSPDGTKLVFTAMRNVHSDIYVMNPDGTNQTRLTDSAGYDFVPQWSTEGTKITFESSRDGYYKFYSMNADGSNQAILHNVAVYGHSWSPDGSKIAYGAYPPAGNLDIYTINSGGGGQLNLTNTSAETELRPDWSPDGAKFAFEYYNVSTGDTQISLMNADGSGTKTVLATPADDNEPDWQRLDAPAHALPVLALGDSTLQASGGDADAYVEPGEGGSLDIALLNRGEGTARNVSATLTTSTPGVTLTSATSAYPDLAPGGGDSNSAPFTFNLAGNVACGLLVDFTITVSYTRGASQLTRAFDFSVQTGQATATPTAFSYAGPAAPIPDDDPAGVSIPVSVSGFAGAVQDINFSFGGSQCTTAPGATTVGLDHTWLGDLVITLTSPQGTSVVIYDQDAGSDVNLCQTVFDDEAADYLNGYAPFTGSFKPANPLSAFDGENPNGTWVLKVVDTYSWDTGNVRAFSLGVTAFDCD